MTPVIYENEYEERVLAPAMLNYTGEIRSNLMGLEPSDIESGRCRWLLKTIQGMTRAGLPVEMLTITNEMAIQRKGADEGEGPALPFGCDQAWLVDLAQQSHMTANHAHYVSSVKAAAHRRRLDAALSAVNHARERGLSVEEAARAIYAEFQRYESTKDTGAPVILADLLPGVYEGWRAHTDGETVGLTLEAGGLGEAFGLMKPGELVVVAGRPGSGKTELAVTVTADIGLRQRRPVLYFSLEMNANDMAERFWACDSRLSVDEIQADVDRHNDVLAASMERFRPHQGENAPIYIKAADMLNTAQLVASAEAWADSVVNPAALVVDYVGLLELGKSDRHDLAVGAATRALKSLAMRLGVPVIALFQLSRKVEERANKRPINSDLRDSGSIEQDADKIVMVYRDAYYNAQTQLGDLVELINTKRRRGRPSNGYCHFINGHLAPIGNQAYAREQVEEVIRAMDGKR